MARQPATTEYTLQGVMRFLQSEWHRHERDRNAWDIERAELRQRITTLEASVKRADVVQNSLKKYVKILERKVREHQKEAGEAGTAEAAKQSRREDELEKMLRDYQRQVETGMPLPVEDHSQITEARMLLDRFQKEFLYLMSSPANPNPPPQSPPLPIDESEAYSMPQGAGDQMLGNAYPNQLRSQMQSLEPTVQQQEQNQPEIQTHQEQQLQGRSLPSSNFMPRQFQSSSVASDASTSRVVESQVSHLARPANLSGLSQGGPWPQPRSSVDSQQGPESDRHSLSIQPPGYTQQALVPSHANEKQTADPGAWDFGDEPSVTAAKTTNGEKDVFPAADNLPRSHRRKSGGSGHLSNSMLTNIKSDPGTFKLRCGLRGHLDAVRKVIFSGGGSPGEPEICTAGDDGMIKRFHLPRFDFISHTSQDVEGAADFTHRGHDGPVLSLAAWSSSPNFSTGGRALGDGWIFSGGKDATIRVWERGRVDPKATIDGHTDSVWALCVLPTTLGDVFGQNNAHGAANWILLASGAADGVVKLWAISSPPQLTSPLPPPGGRSFRGLGSGRVRNNSMSSGSGFPSSPQPTVASNSPFHYTLIHTISRADGSTAAPTCIAPLSPNGESFVVSYTDAAIVVYDTRTSEEIGSMASLETYDGTIETSVNSVVATTLGLDQNSGSGCDDTETAGPTGGDSNSTTGSGVEGIIISGHEDRFIRFFDANIGQCTYNMIAHPAAISALSLSPDGRELVSAGHDASLRFWSLEKRSCTQEITSHRVMRGEGVCSVVWSQDGRWVISGGGDGMVKVFAR